MAVCSVDEYFIFIWGANSYGQLGVGHTDDMITPSIPCTLQDKTLAIKQVTGGGGHTLILTGDGEVYSCGWNKHGQLGLSTHSTDNVKVPTKLITLRNITKVSCGWNHTLAITYTGGIFAWGCNTHHQLGIPHIKDECSSPLQIPPKLFHDSEVIDIAAGLRHSAAITALGTLYTWGNGKRGQLGNGKVDEIYVNSPKPVNTMVGYQCVKLSATAYNTLVCTSDNSMYCCGCNMYGQCCVQPHNVDDKILTINNVRYSEGGVISSVFIPYKVKPLPPACEVHSGWSHIVVVTMDRRVFTWGRCDYGQLGIGVLQDKKYISIPTEILSLHGVQQVACGSEHNIAITSNNDIVSWGWNEHGMCGTGDESNVLIPKIVTRSFSLHTMSAVLVGAGAGHSMTVFKNII